MARYFSLGGIRTSVERDPPETSFDGSQKQKLSIIVHNGTAGPIVDATVHGKLAGKVVGRRLGPIRSGESAQTIFVVPPGTSWSTTAVEGKLTDGTPFRREMACFVVTAAFGDPDHATVDALRDFRDDHLRNSAPGRRFIAWYYRHGPELAKVLEKHEGLRWAVREVLNCVALGMKALDKPHP